MHCILKNNRIFKTPFVGSYVDVLTADGANIINIVQNIYEDIVSSIKVRMSSLQIFLVSSLQKIISI